MARIRTIKPEFFRHERLQDMEKENPSKYCMMVFAGLFGQCDKLGRFEWKPRTLKLDILPFLDFDMEETLLVLKSNGFVMHYIADGKEYGEIPSFKDHQRINGKEAQEPEKYPRPIVYLLENNKEITREAAVKQRGSNWEAIETTGREGKGREEEEEWKEANCDQRPSENENDGDLLGEKSSSDENEKPDAARTARATADARVKKILDLYNAIECDKQEVRAMTEKRNNAALRVYKFAVAYLKNKNKPADDESVYSLLNKIFRLCEQSRFLSGKVKPSDGRKQFILGYDWLMNQTNLANVIEGKYDD